MLRKHQPDHMLLRAARADAATGLLDIRRLGEMLSRIRGRIVHKALDHVSPLAVPVMLEIGRETVYGEASRRTPGGSRGGTGEGGDAVTSLGRAVHTRRAAAVCSNAGAPRARLRSRWHRAASPIAPARSTGRRRALLVVADLHLEKGSSYRRARRAAAAL